jgi:hypothetical protein
MMMARLPRRGGRQLRGLRAPAACGLKQPAIFKIRPMNNGVLVELSYKRQRRWRACSSESIGVYQIQQRIRTRSASLCIREEAV